MKVIVTFEANSLKELYAEMAAQLAAFEKTAIATTPANAGQAVNIELGVYDPTEAAKSAKKPKRRGRKAKDPIEPADKPAETPAPVDASPHLVAPGEEKQSDIFDFLNVSSTPTQTTVMTEKAILQMKAGETLTQEKLDEPVADITNPFPTPSTEAFKQSVESQSDKGLRVSDVNAAIQKLLETRGDGYQCAVKILADHNAKRAADLKPEQFVGVVQACEAEVKNYAG